jgi:hypothetical protein
LFFFVPKVWGLTGDQTLVYQAQTYAELSRARGGASQHVLDNYYSSDYSDLAKQRLWQAGPWRVFRTWLTGTIRNVGVVYYSAYTHALGISPLYIGNELEKTNVVNAILRAIAAAPGIFRGLLIVEFGLMALQLGSVFYLIAIDRSDWRRNVFLMLSLAYLAAVGGLMSEGRARVPLEPFFSLCVGFAIANVIQRFSGNGWRAVQH